MDTPMLNLCNRELQDRVRERMAQLVDRAGELCSDLALAAMDHEAEPELEAELVAVTHEIDFLEGLL